MKARRSSSYTEAQIGRELFRAIQQYRLPRDEDERIIGRFNLLRITKMHGASVRQWTLAMQTLNQEMQFEEF